MRAYVLGAGASFPIYPLGGSLFAAIDKHIQACAPCFDRFDYTIDWLRLKEFLGKNSNPLLRQAYRNENIEQIFTVLDLADNLILNSFSDVMRASKLGVQAVHDAEQSHKALTDEIAQYRWVRGILLWAMEAFFLDAHEGNLNEYGSARWANLQRFGALLEAGDVVMTFNYDSTVERVLHHLGKWAPADGYGTQVVFQESEYDPTPVTFPPSSVKVLHLHGAVGWYEKPVFSPSFDPASSAPGAIPRTALSAAPLGTEIALDPILLRGFGIHHVDASLPARPPNKPQIMLHPSYLKLYGGSGQANRIFGRLWKDALNALRDAEEVTVIGYSLPSADSAAWTLLHTGCERGRTVVVNPDRSVLMGQYSSLLRAPSLTTPMDFGAWLDYRDSLT